MSARTDRFIGCLLGAVVGDCVGSRLDGLESGPIAYRFATDESFLELEPGSCGAASEMTVAVATSLAESRGLDMDDMKSKMADAMTSHHFYGATTTHSLEAAADDSGAQPWESISRGRESYGNGAAARCAPIGLVYCDDADELRSAAEQAAGITHRHALGTEGAVVQATAVALALLGGGRKISGQRFLAGLQAETLAREFQSRLRVAGDLLDRKHVERDTVIARLGNNKTALGSVVTAIYCFVRHPNSFERAVALAASLGGNSATLASMTGAVSGAFLGSSAVPPRWTGTLSAGAITTASLAELGIALTDCEPVSNH